MLSTEALSYILQKNNPYPCFALLESGLVSYREAKHKTIPQELLKDFTDIYGQEAADDAIKSLIDTEAFINTEKGISINDAGITMISEWLNHIKRNLELKLNNNEETIEEFIVKLVSYLKESASCSVSYESGENLDYVLSWDKNKHSIQVAFSPVWLPSVAEKASKDNTFIALIGPFAAQNWQQMIKYYDHPEFRNHVSYFDPWNCQKMNISRGGLFTYFDWFFRDVYGLKFIIPDTFSLALHDIGLLRFNDEK